jgi:hypothetical protein
MRNRWLNRQSKSRLNGRLNSQLNGTQGRRLRRQRRFQAERSSTGQLCRQICRRLRSQRSSAWLKPKFDRRTTPHTMRQCTGGRKAQWKREIRCRWLCSQFWTLELGSRPRIMPSCFESRSSPLGSQIHA